MPSRPGPILVAIPGTFSQFFSYSQNCIVLIVLPPQSQASPCLLDLPRSVGYQTHKCAFPALTTDTADDAGSGSGRHGLLRSRRPSLSVPVSPTSYSMSSHLKSDLKSDLISHLTYISFAHPVGITSPSHPHPSLPEHIHASPLTIPSWVPISTHLASA